MKASCHSHEIKNGVTQNLSYTVFSLKLIEDFLRTSLAYSTAFSDSAIGIFAMERRMKRLTKTIKKMVQTMARR